MVIDLQEKVRIDIIENDLLKARNIELGILRLDQIHPVVSGNKWFKLKYNINEAIVSGHKSILTFGGAYSNHLVATAAAANAFGLSSIGIVRGLHARENHTDTLHACENMGMRLHFITREAYGRKEEESFLYHLQQEFKDSFMIPEGGNNEAGRKGTAEIVNFIPPSYTHILLAIGTGATFSGIRTSVSPDTKMLGFIVMKEGDYLSDSIKGSLSQPKENWSLVTDYHFGGFAKSNDTLIEFMNHFYHQYQIPLDKVYTGKLLYGVMDMITNQRFPEGSKLLCIHTGGLQGNQSIKDKLLF